MSSLLPLMLDIRHWLDDSGQPVPQIRRRVLHFARLIEYGRPAQVEADARDADRMPTTSWPRALSWPALSPRRPRTPSRCSAWLASISTRRSLVGTRLIGLRGRWSQRTLARCRQRERLVICSTRVEGHVGQDGEVVIIGSYCTCIIVFTRPSTAPRKARALGDSPPSG